MNRLTAQRSLLIDQRGFTLIELLVVVLIIGILAAIAIPAFLGQRQKAQDSSAKSMARNAASAAGVYATDNNGSYASMVIGDLTATEPSLTDGGSVKTVAAITNTPNATGYTVSVQSNSDKWFNLTRSSGNTYRCTGTAAAVCTASSTPKW